MKGRSSNKEINNRILIGIALLKEYNYQIGNQQFRKLYKEKLAENEINVPKDSRTITSDIEDMKKRLRAEFDQDITWANGTVEKPKPNSIFSVLGNDISAYIRKVYLCINNNEYVLYRDSSPLKSINKFKKPIKELYQLRKDELLSKDTLVRIYIIFNESGYEEMTADFFNTNGEIEKVLFTSALNFCTEIVSELRYLKTITDDLYYTIYP